VAALIQLSILAVALFAVFGSVVSAAAHSLLRQRLMQVAPARRARALLALCVLPAMSAIGLTALCFFPSTLSTLWSGVDHCLEHGDGHLHFCLAHAPSSSESSFGWLIAGIVAAGLLLRGLHSFSRMGHAHRTLRQLFHAAVFDHGREVWLVESDVPLAVTIGIRRPRILVSTELLRKMPSELVDAVVEHERAHVRRRDVLGKLVASLLSLLHLPRTRRGLLAALDLASEQACDEEAAVRVGDRLRVAQALLYVQRLLQGSTVNLGLAGVAFEGSSVAPRVESLLADAMPPGSSQSARWLAAAAVALVLLAEPLHHQTETILGLITR